MPKARLGVAILIPPPLDREVDALRRAVGDPALGRIPAHLTLVPPVNVREDEMTDAVGVLRAAADATRPFRVTIGPPATFLPVNPVLYLAVSGDLDALAGLRERVFRPPLERALTHPFVPHVTIADEADEARIRAGLLALADFRAGVAFDRVHLLREGEGRVWSPIGDWELGAPAVVGRGGLEVEITVGARLDPQGEEFARREWPRADAQEFGASGFRTPIALTARRTGEVVGVAGGYVSGPRAHLSELLVGPDVRGEGVGSHLLAAFESRAVTLGAEFLTLETAKDGRAEAFYGARGWRRVAVLPRENFDRDFVRMERRLA